MNEEDVKKFLELSNYRHFRTSRQRLKEKLVKYKGGKCEICGYNKCINALEFHHLDPTKKDFGIANGNAIAFEKAKKEVDKCILVCSNCHREIHYDLNEKQYAIADLECVFNNSINSSFDGLLSTFLLLLYCILFSFKKRLNVLLFI